MTTAIQSNVVPETIVQKLNSLIWRARVVLCLRGAMAVVATAIVSLLMIMAIDRWVVIFASWPRWVLSGGGLALTALVGGWMLVRPLARSFTLTGIARLIESRHPELQERISSTVELLTSDDSPEMRGSDALIAALADEAVLDARTVRAGREIRFKKAWPYLAAAVCVFTVLVAVVTIWPGQASPLLRRALMPFANISRVSSTALSITTVSAPDLIKWDRDGIDYVMLTGRRLHVELEVSDDAVTSAEMRRTPLAGGEESVSLMTALPRDNGGPRRFAVTCQPAGEDFRFRIHAGDALTRYYIIRVVPQPAIRQIDLRYDYPAYTRREADVQRSAAGNIAAVAGTLATLTARTNKPVASAELLLDGQVQPAEMSTDLDGTTVCMFRIQLVQGLKSRWSARLRDEYGFASDPVEHPVKALPDQRPKVDVVMPTTTRLKMKPSDSLPISYRLSDDFGVASAEMLVEIDGRAEKPAPLALKGDAERPARSQAGATALNLASLPLAGARQVTFRLRARDILPPELKGPQEGFSELFTIQLDIQAPSYVEQILLAEELRIRQVLQSVLKELEKAKEDSAPLRRIASKTPAVNEPIITRVDRMRQHLGSADTMLRDLTKEIAGGTYAPLAAKITTIADDHVAKALDLAGQIKLTDRPKDRGTMADEADFQVDRSIALVKELLEQFGEMSAKLHKAVELQDLAARQDELAEALAEKAQAEATPPEAGQEPMNPEDWQKAQEQVADRLADVAKQTPGAVEAALKADKEKARNLLTEAKDLAKDQRELAQETAKAAKLETLSQALEALADRQEKLAQQAEATKAAAEPAKPMKSAAEDIRADKLQEAVDKQTAAEQELQKLSEKGAEAKAAESLAQQAENIARQQKALADQAQAAQQKAQAAEAQAAAAQQKAQQAKQQAADAQKAAGEKARSLQARQQELARATEELQKQAAANPATAEAAKAADPVERMKAAAQELAAGRPDNAAPHAASAERRSQRLADQLQAAHQQANAAKGEQRNEKQVQAAAQATEKARGIAEQQKKLSEEIAAAADQGAKQTASSQQAAQQAAGEQAQANAQAAQAKQQAAQLAQNQDNVRSQASELARQAAKAGAEAAKAAQEHNPVPEMTQAAQAMRNSQPAPAAEQARKAADEAAQLAEALRQASKAAPSGAKEQAPQLAELARQQEQLRKETARMMAQVDQAQKATARQEMGRLQQEQAKIAAEAEKLSDSVKKDAPQADRLDTQAARNAREAADELAQGKAAEAAQDAAEAGQELGQLAQRLNKEAGRAAQQEQAGQEQGEKPGQQGEKPGQQGEKPGQQGEQPGQQGEKPGQQGEQSGQQGEKPGQQGQPSGQQQVAATGSTAQQPEQMATGAGEMARKAELADATGELARRQQALAEQIKALAANDATALAESKQADLARRTGDLNQAVERIAEHAQELIPDQAARREAEQASDQLDRAEAAQAQAGKALQADQPAQATGPQQQSASALAAAAAALERLGRQLAAAAQQAHPAEAAEDSQDLANAYDSAGEAAQSQQLSDAARAAQQLQALAQAAAAQAQAMGMDPGQVGQMAQRSTMPGKPGFNLDSQIGTGVQMTVLTEAELKKLGLSLSDWARLPGKLRDQVLQAASSDSPEEYRPLIRRYFREIARRGGTSAAGNSSEKK